MKETDERNNPETAEDLQEASGLQNEQRDIEMIQEPAAHDTEEKNSVPDQAIPEGLSTNLFLEKTALDEWAEGVFEPFEDSDSPIPDTDPDINIPKMIETDAIQELENPDVFAAAAERMTEAEAAAEEISEAIVEQAETAAAISVLDAAMPEVFETEQVLEQLALEGADTGVFAPAEDAELGADETLAEEAMMESVAEDIPTLDNPDVFAEAAERMIQDEAAAEEFSEAIEEQAEKAAAISVLDAAMPEVFETEQVLEQLALEGADTGVFAPAEEEEEYEAEALVKEAMMESVAEDIPALDNPDVFAEAAERMIQDEAAAEEFSEAIAEQAETAAVTSVLDAAMPEVFETEQVLEQLALEGADTGVFAPAEETEEYEAEALAEAAMKESVAEDIPALDNPDVFAQEAERQIMTEEVTEAIEESLAAEQEVTESSVLEASLPELFEAEGAKKGSDPYDTPETEESVQESTEEKTSVQEPMVEQLSLLDDQLPHLEAANAPEARKARAVLEGLLFLVGDDGITAEQAAATLDIAPELAQEYFDDLMKVYLADDRGIEIANYGGTYRFLSKASVHEYAKKLFQISKQATLSQAALETLAIIAYKQPITRVEIEEIRGVGADMMLRKLMARDLIRESGRSEAAGRPILYEVTEEFMNSFKLMSLKELPELPQFNESEESEDLFRQ